MIIHHPGTTLTGKGVEVEGADARSNETIVGTESLKRNRGQSRHMHKDMFIRSRATQYSGPEDIGVVNRHDKRVGGVDRQPPMAREG